MSETRRDFLKKGAAIAGGAVVAGSAAGLFEPGEAIAGRLRTEGRGRVIGVESPKAMRSLNSEAPAVVVRRTNEALLRFTGKRTVAQAWRVFVHPKDVVGIKLNCLGAPGISTSPAMVGAIVKGLQAVGIPNDRIILYEQYQRQLVRRGSGFALNEDPAKGPLCRHTGGREPLADGGWLGYETTADRHGSGTSHYANMLKHCTAIVNAPVIKDHNLAGVTVGMKNMTHGNINNPHHFHEHDCNPQIADIYNHPKIKDRVRVIVCDGLRVLYDGGPQDNNRAKVRHDRIYVATDPVAMDSWGYYVVEDLRKKHGLDPLAKRHATGTYLVKAEKLGLGVHQRAGIDCKVTPLG